MKTKRLIGVSLLLCYVVCMDTIYRLISYYQTGTAMTPALFPWLLWVLGLYGLDLLLLRKGGSLSRYLWLHVVSWGILSVLGNLYWIQAQGLTARMFAVIFYGISLVMAEETARLGVKPNQTLVQTEAMLILLGILLFLEEMHMAPDSPSRYWALAGVIVSLLSLIMTRVMTDEGGRTRGSRIQGAFLLGSVFMLLTICGLGFAAAFSGRGRMALQFLVELVLKGGRWALAFLGRCLDKLVALFPVGEEELPPLEAPVVLPGTEELSQASGTLPAWVLPLLVILAALAVGLGFLWLLRRLRHVRMPGLAGEGLKTSKGVEKKSLVRQRLGELWEKWRHRLWFRYQCLRQRNSLPVLLLTAESYGKRHGIIRQPKESPQSYLRRLSGEEKLSGAGQGETLEEIARALEEFFYRGKATDAHVGKVREWKRVFR